MGRSVALSLPWPPSANTYYRSIAIKGRPRVLISKQGRQYRETVGLICAAHVGLGDAPVAVTIELYPPDRRKFDVDNRLKPLLDALQHAGIFDDDAQVQMLQVAKYPRDPAIRAVAKVSIVTLEITSC